MRLPYLPITLEWLEHVVQERYAYSTKEAQQRHVELLHTLLVEPLHGAMLEGSLSKDYTIDASTK